MTHRNNVLPLTLHNLNTDKPGELYIFPPYATSLNFVVERGFIYYQGNAKEINNHEIIKNEWFFQKNDRYHKEDQQQNHQNWILNSIGDVVPASSDHLIVEVTYVGRA